MEALHDLNDIVDNLCAVSQVPPNWERSVNIYSNKSR